MELANGFRTLASGRTVFFADGLPVPTEPCPWLVERRNPNFDIPEWYPDFPSDVYVVVECGAPAVLPREGGLHCSAGHELGTLEEELAPGGREWQRELADR